MTRPTDFGAECEHGRLARKCERCDDAETIADLRDRLRIMAPMVCDRCGCAPAEDVCPDCWSASQPQDGMMHGRVRKASASVSVGLRALCGRRLLGGCE